MREIKFRAWDKSKLEMINNVVVNSEMKYPLSIRGDAITVNPKDYPVMQFTGLKDKNGKEIYEGDIVKFTTAIANQEKTEIRQVCWGDNDTAGFMTSTSLVPNVFNTFGYLAGQYSSDYEVIGNIYENPELLSPERKQTEVKE